MVVSGAELRGGAGIFVHPGTKSSSSGVSRKPRAPGKESAFGRRISR